MCRGLFQRVRKGFHFRCVVTFCSRYALRPCLAVPPFEHFTTYGEVFEQASALAARFEKGSKIGIRMMDRFRFYVADLACILSESTSVAISPVHHKLDLLNGCDLILDDLSDFKTVFARHGRENAEQGIYTVFFSSGSTGFPKGVKISCDAFLKGL